VERKKGLSKMGKRVFSKKKTAKKSSQAREKKMKFEKGKKAVIQGKGSTKGDKPWQKVPFAGKKPLWKKTWKETAGDHW